MIDHVVYSQVFLTFTVSESLKLSVILNLHHNLLTTQQGVEIDSFCLRGASEILTEPLTKQSGVLNNHHKRLLLE